MLYRDGSHQGQSGTGAAAITLSLVFARAFLKMSTSVPTSSHGRILDPLRILINPAAAPSSRRSGGVPFPPARSFLDFSFACDNSSYDTNIVLSCFH
eukprot:g4045.t1